MTAFEVFALPDEPSDGRRRVILWNYDGLDAVDRNYARRAYRILRLAMYAPQSSEYAEGGMYQGCYGMDRDEAKEYIAEFFGEVAWKSYIGSK